MKTVFKILLILVVFLCLAGLMFSCQGRSGYAYQQTAYAQPAYADPAPASVYVQPAPVYVERHDGFLTGMLVGHALSGSTSRQTNVVVNKTVINNRPVYTRPAAPPPAYRPSSSSFSSRPSFGGRRR